MKSYINSDSEILGGMPVIAGTRIPVSRIIQLLKEGYTVETIHEDYPQVKTQILESVIDEVAEIINSKSASKI